MAENSAIEWTDHTFNPWVGCTKVGPGCDHCYAEAWAKRGGTAAGVTWGGQRRRTGEATWRQPLKWNTQAQREGRRFRVFCASLADVFDNQVPDDWRVELFELIRATPHLDWLLLTKRIGNAASMIQATLACMDIGYSVPFAAWPWPNVWLGVTVVNQAEADRDIPKLLAVPARVRFLSIEPMLGPIDLGLRCENWSDDIVMDPETGAYECCKACDHTGVGNAIDWVICGGESGPHARPMHPDWARSLRDQCAAAGVPFLFKQWGEWGEPDSIERTGVARQGWWEPDRDDGGMPRHEWPGPVQDGIELSSLRPEVYRVGKKAAGRLLDGVTHDGSPAPPAWAANGGQP